MKKLILAVAIISLAWFGLAKADSTTPQQFVDNLSQVPVKVQSFISSEIEKRPTGGLSRGCNTPLGCWLGELDSDLIQIQ